MRRAVVLSALAVASCGGTAPRVVTSHSPPATRATTSGGAPPAPHRPPAPQRPPVEPRPPFAVAERTLTFTDSSRRVEIPGAGLRPRTLVTVVRYPRAPGRFPLIIFGHGFAVTPALYAQLLEAWAHAGYVVAAPIFPLENANAPGGPNESDIVNQPADESFVITEMLRSPAFRGRIDAGEVAVSGQSDGGNTALALAYAARRRDRRVRATVILSGGEVPPVADLDLSVPGPPLLATQGTADTINPPAFTRAFFDPAPRPKYLLELLGASHLPPYTGGAPWAAATTRVTTAFLDSYLKRAPGAMQRMRAEGAVPGVAALQSDP